MTRDGKICVCRNADSTQWTSLSVNRPKKAHSNSLSFTRSIIEEDFLFTLNQFMNNSNKSVDPRLTVI